MKKSDVEKTITYTLLHRIWHDVVPEKILEACKKARPERRWSMAGKLIRCLCPSHEGANTETFHLDFERGFGVCYACGYYNSNFLDLYNCLTDGRMYETYPQIVKALGLKSLPKTYATYCAWAYAQNLRRRVMQISHDFLVAALNDPQNENFIWATDAVEWLTQTRQVPSAVIPQIEPLGVFPPVSMLLQELEVRDARDLDAWRAKASGGGYFEKPHRYADDAAAIFQDKSGINYNNWAGSAVFQYNYTHDVIGGLKLRRIDTNETTFLCKAEPETGFFGLGWGQYACLRQNVDPRKQPVYVVKSEFDVLSLASRLLYNAGVIDMALVAGSTSGENTPMDYLPHSGFSDAMLIPDSGASGEGNVKSWLSASHQVRTRIFNDADGLKQARDLDVAVLTHGEELCHTTILKEDNYIAPQDWAFEHVTPSVEAIELKDLRSRVSVCADYGRILRDPTECDAYTEMCGKRWGLPMTAIRREIVAKDEDEPGFILRIANALTKEFYIVGQDAGDNSRRLYLWHRPTAQLTWVNLSDDNHAERQLGPLLGPAYQWYTEQVGIPPFLEVSDEDREAGTYLQERDKALRWYTRQALLHISMTAPNYAAASHYAQGLHTVIKRGNDAVFYLVNGPTVYHGVPAPNDTVQWRELEGPSHDGNIFETGLRRQMPAWLRTVRTAADIERGAEIDVRGVYDRLANILNVGWRFENHDMVVRFLAAHLIATTIGNAFGRSVSVGFHANSSSGKSRLCMGLISGKDFPRIQVLSVAHGTSNFTAAGVRQEMNNCTRALVLDEFEDEGAHDRKSHEVENVYAMMRSAVGANNTFRMGSRDGNAVEYRLNFYLFVGAINKPRKVQDANRMIAINMAHVVGRADPVQLIIGAVGDEYIQTLRDDLEVVALARIPQFRKIYSDLEVEFNKPGAKPPGVDQRYFETLLPALTIMKYLGMDYARFGYDFAEMTNAVSPASSQKSESQLLMDWVFQSPAIFATLEPGRPPVRTSLNQLLSAPETRELINATNSGVYFDVQSSTVVVNWLQALQTVLSSHPRFRSELNVANIRDLANRASCAMSHAALVQSGILERLKRQGLFNVPSTSLTAYNVANILGQADAVSSPLADPPAKIKEETLLPREAEAVPKREPSFS